MNIFTVTLIILFAVSSLFLAGGLAGFAQACRRNKLRDRAPDGIVDIAHYEYRGEAAMAALRKYEERAKEKVSVTSFDGLRLAGSYIPAEGESKRLVIAFHGYYSCAAADFSALSEEFLSRGWSMLLPDQRSHGRSEGKYICFGALERFDCRSWCEYAVRRFGEDTEICLLGVSMGAATVLMSSGLKLPKNVKAIIADCGFTTPWEVIKLKTKRKYRLPVYPLIYFMNYWSRVLAKFDFREASTVDALKKTDLPVLILHGSADRVVPIRMSEENIAAASNASFVRFEEVGHARCCLSDPERYIGEVFGFIENNI